MRIHSFLAVALLAVPALAQTATVPPAAVNPTAAIPNALSSDKAGLPTDGQLNTDAAVLGAVTNGVKPAPDSPLGRVAAAHIRLDAATKKLADDTANSANRTTLKADHNDITAAKRQLDLDQKACIALEKAKGTSDNTLATVACQ